MHDAVKFALTLGVAHTVPFWLCNAVLYFAYSRNWLMQYRIQGKHYPSPDLVRACLKSLVVDHVLLQWFFWASAFPGFVYFGGDKVMTWDLPRPFVLLAQLAFCVFVNDTLFYWAHRALHHRSVYKYIHKQHHEFKATVGIASEYAHPVEAFLANFLPTILGPLLLGANLAVTSLWLVIRIVETVYGHSGYSIPWSPFEMFWWQGGAARHDFHHSHNRGNFGSFTIFWDRVMGTEQPYLEHMQKQAELRQAGQTKRVE